MLSPLFSLCPCDMTRMEPLCKGTFLCVVSLPVVGSFARKCAGPKEEEAGATEQDLSCPCSAPHAGTSSSHPDQQSYIHTRAPAGICFLQDLPWSKSSPSQLAKVTSPSTGEEGSLGTKVEFPSHPTLLVEGQNRSLGCCPRIPEKHQCQPSTSKNRGGNSLGLYSQIPIESDSVNSSSFPCVKPMAGGQVSSTKSCQSTE